MHAAIACGGTGGHVFPGLATAMELKKQGHQVTLWLSGRDVENMAVTGWDGPMHKIAVTGFASIFSLKSLDVCRKLLQAFNVCRRIMKTERPDVILGMGSYACVAPVLAARSLRIPVVLHESNAVPGRAVSMLSHCASAVGLVFSSAGDRLHCSRKVVTGFPVRPELEALGRHQRDRGAGLTVLVMGGSQGSKKLNEVCAEAVCSLHGAGLDVGVIHLAGTADEKQVRARYAEAGVRHEVHAFLSDMREAFARVDAAISRSGASACAEMAVCGIPCLLIPLPHARRNHQMANALRLAADGGAVVLAEDDLSAERVAGFLKKCIEQPEALAAMRTGQAGMAVHDGARKLAELVTDVAESASGKR